MRTWLGRQLSRISWRNYLIPNRYWRLVKSEDFVGTYRGIPIYRSKHLEEVSPDAK